jgi:signal transduction histidine kinase
MEFVLKVIGSLFVSLVWFSLWATKAGVAVGERGVITVRVAQDARQIALTVGDDGVGMSDDVKLRALEPFFTTRPPGEGSGLGLAIAAQIIRAHKGTLELDSATGQGTRVRIRLPVQSSH